MRLSASIPALLLAGACTSALGAQAPTPAEAMRLLSQMSNAARQLNYVGTFVYRHGNHSETSRIWHLNDESGSYERLQTLDGPPREIVRVNDVVTCYYPDSKRAKAEKGNTNRRFPAVVSEQLVSIFASYNLRKMGMDRVAGYDCQVTVLEPRDAMRYGHAFCAELKTGLPLRAKTFNERNEAVETFAFTQVEIGASVTRDHVRPSFDAAGSGWVLDKSALTLAPEAESRWVVVNRPAGFRKVMEVKRSIHGKAASQLVFSDGLAAVSIFIEPAVAGARASQELTHHGAINIFSRPQAGHVITALGEAPAPTVIQFGNAVAPRVKPNN